MRRLHKREKWKRQKSDKLDLHVSLPHVSSIILIHFELISSIQISDSTTCFLPSSLNFQFSNVLPSSSTYIFRFSAGRGSPATNPSSIASPRYTIDKKLHKGDNDQNFFGPHKKVTPKLG